MANEPLQADDGVTEEIIVRSIDSKSEGDLIDDASRDDDLQEDNSMNLKVDDEPHFPKDDTIGEFDPMLFTLNYPALELFPSQKTKTPSYCFRSVSVTTCIR